MAQAQEKWSTKERETLIYRTPEQAREWREGVQEKIAQQAGREVTREREIVAEAVAEEFTQAGYAVDSLTRPWEHTPQEHAEVQGLVNLAFATDLSLALKQARQSPNWPRNLDLFHDVLTTEMYSLVQAHKLNRQPLSGWALFVAGIVLAATLVSILLIVLA